MKLAILGGGGFRVPQVYAALAAPDAVPHVDEVSLFDLDADKLATICAVIDGRGHTSGPQVSATTDLDEALRGADFIFSAIRVGGLAGRVADEKVALGLGVLGQETTGAGGLSYALRTVPVMQTIAQRVRAVAPGAWFINFTNPAGIVTESLLELLEGRVVGICDTPIGLLRRAARQLGAPVDEFDYVGLNHLGWLRSITHEGRDVLPQLLGSDAALTHIEEARLMGFDWVRALGALPNEYLYYYYYTREAVARLRGGGPTRGEFLTAQQGDFFAQAGRDHAHAAELWAATLHQREATYMAESREVGHEADRDPSDMGGGYDAVALQIMAAICGGDPATLILNVPNSADGGGRVVPDLPAGCVVEVPCVVDSTGIHPRAVAPVTGHMLGLMQSVKAVEQLVIQAVAEHSAELAWKAFAVHPLVDSVAIARDLLRSYQRAHPELAYLT